MKHCRLCKYYLCLACYGNETCPGNHGLRLSRPSKVKLNNNNNTHSNNNTEMKTASNSHSSHSSNKKHSSHSNNNSNDGIITCGKCRRVFDKPNIPLYLCNECKYYLCSDCYQPSKLFHRKLKKKNKNKKINTTTTTTIIIQKI